MSLHAPTPSIDPRFCLCGHPVKDATHISPAFTARSKVVARRSDPDTSWEAARSVTKVTEKQEAVLGLFRAFGHMTDEQAWQSYKGWLRMSETPMSVSGFRTRRAELVAMGLLRDSGLRVVGSTGRKMIVWAAT